MIPQFAKEPIKHKDQYEALYSAVTGVWDLSYFTGMTIVEVLMFLDETAPFDPDSTVADATALNIYNENPGYRVADEDDPLIRFRA